MKITDFFNINRYNPYSMWITTKSKPYLYLNKDGVLRSTCKNEFSDGWFSCMGEADIAFKIWATNNLKEESAVSQCMRRMSVQVNPTMSKVVQQVAFANGLAWWDGEKEINHTQYDFLYIDDRGGKFSLGACYESAVRSETVSVEEFLVNLLRPIEDHIIIAGHKLKFQGDRVFYDGRSWDNITIKKIVDISSLITSNDITIAGHDPQFFRDGSIKIGCTTLSKEIVDKIAKKIGI